MQRRRHHHGLTQRKSLGQVFLREDWPSKKIVEALQETGVQSVLEIGPGDGALTRHLLEAGLIVTSLEKDSRFFERLQERWSSENRFEVVEGDILQFDLATWITRSSGRVAICGNVPYNISSPLLRNVLAVIQELSCIVLMFQEEFAHRVVSKAGSKSYGSLSVYCQLRAKAQLEFKVPKFCFSPIPKVDSAVISLKPIRVQRSQELLGRVETLTRQAFNNRRKKLSNSLSNFLKELDQQTTPFDLNRRCETLTPEEFVAMSEYFYEASQK